MSKIAKTPDPEPYALPSDPFWGVACVLADIARRVARRRAAEHATDTPETRYGAGRDPVPRGERTER